MMESLLIVCLLAGVPIAYFLGRRSGFERHHCVWTADPEDRAPLTYITVTCQTCDEGIDCELHVVQDDVDGVPTLTATIDTTDLEHHTLRHDEARRPLT